MAELGDVRSDRGGVRLAVYVPLAASKFVDGQLHDPIQTVDRSTLGLHLLEVFVYLKLTHDERIHPLSRAANEYSDARTSLVETGAREVSGQDLQRIRRVREIVYGFRVIGEEGGVIEQ